jgi:predicted nucleotidyltransferase
MCSVFDVNEIERCARGIAEQFSAVVAVYIFGSVCTNKCGPLSDIDIAVLVDPSVDTDAVCGDFQDELCRRLKTDRIDLVSLVKAPSGLAYRVIKDGHSIYCCDKKHVESFESLTVMKYLDFKPVLERAFQVSSARTMEAA